jgi:hypothetical protein
MVKIWVISLFFFLFAEEVYSQWSTNDSIWLNDVLSNRKELRLNPEVIEAIKSGNLINTYNSKPDAQSINAHYELPLHKDFQYHTYKYDPAVQKIDLTKIPPSVFMLYFNEPVEIVKLQSFSMVGIENYKPDRPVTPLLNTDPLAKGQVNGMVRYMICINDVINYYFLKKRN